MDVFIKYFINGADCRSCIWLNEFATNDGEWNAGLASISSACKVKKIAVLLPVFCANDASDTWRGICKKNSTALLKGGLKYCK